MVKAMQASAKAMQHATTAMVAHTKAMGATQRSTAMLAANTRRLSANAAASQRASKAAQQFHGVNSRLQNLGQGVIGGAIGAVGFQGMSSFISSPMEMEQQMKILSTKLSESGPETMKALQALALKIGSGESIFTPAQVAKSFVDMASGGMEQADIRNNAKTILDVATANQIQDPAIVADLMTNVMQGLYGGGADSRDPAKMLKMADMVQYTADKTSAGFMDMMTAAKYAIPAFKMAGWSFRDMNAMLGLLSNNTIKGGDAGTDLQGIVSRLAKTFGNDKSVLAKAGLVGKKSLFSAKGEIKDGLTVMTLLRDATVKMSSGEKISFISKLVGQENMKSLSIMIEGVDDLKAAAATLDNVPTGQISTKATLQMDTLNGSVSRLKGTFNGLAATVYADLRPSLMWLADNGIKALKWMDKFAEAHPEIVKVAAGLVAVGAALKVVTMLFSVGTFLGGATGLAALGNTMKLALFGPGLRIAAMSTFGAGGWLLPVILAGMAGWGIGEILADHTIRPYFEKLTKDWMDEFKKLTDTTKIQQDTTKLGQAGIPIASVQANRMKTAQEALDEGRKASAILDKDRKRKEEWSWVDTFRTHGIFGIGYKPDDRLDENTISGLHSKMSIANTLAQANMATNFAENAAQQALMTGSVDAFNDPNIGPSGDRGAARRFAQALMAQSDPTGIAKAKEAAIARGEDPSHITIHINNTGIGLDDIRSMTLEQVTDAVMRARQEQLRGQAASERHSRMGDSGTAK